MAQMTIKAAIEVLQAMNKDKIVNISFQSSNESKDSRDHDYDDHPNRIYPTANSSQFD